MASEGNVEIVRGILAHWERGDFRKAVELFDPELDFATFMPDATADVVTRGTRDFEAFSRDWLSQWRDYRIVGESFRSVDPDKVFVSVRQIATGEQSGAAVESPGFSVWTLRAGRVVKLSLHYDKNQALQAAGLSE